MGADGLPRALARPSGPADQATVRRSNLELVLRHVYENGPRSRADIAVETELNKATVSSLVSELMMRGLVREAGLRHGGMVGRPARIIEMDGAGVAALGLEVNADYIAAYGTDLAGRTLVDQRTSFDAMGAPAEESLDELVRITAAALESVAKAGARVAGITVAVPGLVDVARGSVLFAPNLQWRDVAVADYVRSHLGRTDLPVRVENDANLGALAEFRVGRESGTRHLVYLTGEVGVGGGVIVDGHLLRGATGFSGEVGHMPVDVQGARCGCGRIGCWETKVGLAVLVRNAAPDLAYEKSNARDPEERLAEVLERASRCDERAAEALDDVGRWLGHGAAILCNLFNPSVIVLGGYFARVADYVVPRAQQELERLVIAGPAAQCQIVPSQLGFGAAVRGGVGLAIEAVLTNPASVHYLDESAVTL